MSRPPFRPPHGSRGGQPRPTPPAYPPFSHIQPGPTMFTQPAANFSPGYALQGHTMNQMPKNMNPYGQVWSNTSEGYSYSGAYTGASTSRPPKKPRTEGATYATGESSGTSAWRNCSVAGCHFVGPGNEVEIHEADRHLLFAKGKQVERSEEEERYVKQKGPAPTIEGTTISLETDEDIAKWIAERKARWPSAKRIQEKRAEHQAAIDRGDLPMRSGGRGRGTARGAFGRRQYDPAAQAEDWGRSPSIQNGSERGMRGRGRGRGERRGRGAGHGRGDMARSRERERDNGWRGKADSPVQAADRPEPHIAPSTTGITGLAAYGSGSGTEETSDTSSTTSSDEDSSATDTERSVDDEEPARDPAPTEESVVNPDKKASGRPICRFFARNGKCKLGDRCRYAHTGSDSTAQGRQPAPEQKPRTQRQPPSRPANPFERPAMLSQLLANPIQNTLSQISQTIRFLVANDMLKDVELRPGDNEAMEGGQGGIAEVGRTPSEPHVSSEIM